MKIKGISNKVPTGSIENQLRELAWLGVASIQDRLAIWPNAAGYYLLQAGTTQVGVVQAAVPGKPGWCAMRMCDDAKPYFAKGIKDYGTTPQEAIFNFLKHWR